MPAAPRLLVTRPQPQADEWVAQLRAAGCDAVALPLLAVAPLADEASRAALQAMWAGLADFRLLMFVSPAAVAQAFAARPAAEALAAAAAAAAAAAGSAANAATAEIAARLPGTAAPSPSSPPPSPATPPGPSPAPSPTPWPAGTWAAATGPGTAAALLRAGVPATRVISPPADAPRFDSEALWPLLQGLGGWAGARVCVLRGEGGRDWLSDALRAEGAQVQALQAYARGAARPGAAEARTLWQALCRPADHAWLLSSSEALQHLPAVWAAAQPLAGAAPDGSAAPALDHALRASTALATHPRIAEAARAAGYRCVQVVSPLPPVVAAAVAGLATGDGAGTPAGGPVSTRPAPAAPAPSATPAAPAAPPMPTGHAPPVDTIRADRE